MTRSTAAGLLFLLTFVIGLAGILLFVRRDITGAFDQFALERALILASWLVAKAGAVLLVWVRPGAHTSPFLVAGVVLFTIGAVIAAASEMSEISREFRVTNDWVGVFVSLLLVGGALIGAGLLGSGLVPRHTTFGGFTAASNAPSFVLLLDERASAPSSCVLAG